MPGLSFPAYFALSSSLTALAVSYAFQSRSQFYPAVIYLVTSKPAVLVLGNMGKCVPKRRGVKGGGGKEAWNVWLCGGEGLSALRVPIPWSLGMRVKR